MPLSPLPWSASCSSVGPRFIGLVVAATLACLAGGCGPRRPATVPVKGRVTLDGKPVADAAVIFEPETGGVPARGSTAADGSFTLTTFERDDGAIAGRHRVGVTKVVYEGVKADAGGLEAGPLAGPPKERWEVPSRYAVPAKSGLTADVPGSGAAIDLTLTTKE